MNILIVNTLYSPNQFGGAEISVKNLAEEFVQNGHKATVVCLDKQEKKYAINGVEVIALKIKNNYWPFNDKKRSKLDKILWHKNDICNKEYDVEFSEIIKNTKPDVVFTNNLSGFSTRIWEVAKSFNINVVHTLRDYYLQCPKSTKYKNKSNCKKPCTDCKLFSKEKKKTSLQINHVVGISNFILEDHLKNGYFKGINSSTIYNGFPINSTKHKKENKELVFGFLGQLKPSKGIEFLLEALNSFKEKNWLLKIGGNLDSSYKTKLKQINNSKKIQFLGYLKAENFFKEIDLLIVPSLWNEPFGRVVIEAMLHHTPVLASNVGGIPELMTNNQWFLFDSNQVDFKNKLNAIFKDKLILDNFEYNTAFLESISLKQTAKYYIDIFESVIKKGS